MFRSPKLFCSLPNPFPSLLEPVSSLPNLFSSLPVAVFNRSGPCCSLPKLFKQLPSFCSSNLESSPSLPSSFSSFPRYFPPCCDHCSAFCSHDDCASGGLAAGALAPLDNCEPLTFTQHCNFYVCEHRHRAPRRGGVFHVAKILVNVCFQSIALKYWMRTRQTTPCWANI